MQKQSSLEKIQQFDLTPESLQPLGLKQSDINDVLELSKTISPDNHMAVLEFGRQVAEHSSKYADSLLEQVRNDDLSVAGQKLGEIVLLANQLNKGPLSDKRSKIPLIGPLIDKMRTTKTRILTHFETTKEQIDSLVNEVDITQARIKERNVQLDLMFQTGCEEHRLLGVHIAAAQMRGHEIALEAKQLKADIGNDPAKLQKVIDMESFVEKLSKRVGDLKALQHAALLSLPSIRLVQSNNEMLVDKFHTIREITIPSWKREFVLSLSLNEQQSSVRLAQSIDDMTNESLRRNSELLRQNSVETAKANQRLVIDVDTLRHVQDTLIKTVQDVITIQKNGVTQRIEAERQIEQMRTELKSKLTSAA